MWRAAVAGSRSITDSSGETRNGPASGGLRESALIALGCALFLVADGLMALWFQTLAALAAGVGCCLALAAAIVETRGDPASARPVDTR